MRTDPELISYALDYRARMRAEIDRLRAELCDGLCGPSEEEANEILDTYRDALASERLACSLDRDGYLRENLPAESAALVS